MHFFFLGAIESAIERNDLTDQLVAMAPMAGHDVWFLACSAFADQLVQEGLFMHAANYMLACNKVGTITSFLSRARIHKTCEADTKTTNVCSAYDVTDARDINQEAARIAFATQKRKILRYAYRMSDSEEIKIFSRYKLETVD